MRFTLWIFLCLGFSVSSLFSVAQTGSLRGTITDTSGDPVAYVTVRVTGIKYTAISDQLGNYSFKKIPAGDYILAVSRIGLISDSLPVQVKGSGITVLDLRLSYSSTLLEKIVINGVRTISGMGRLDETHNGVVYSGKKTEVLLLDSLDANTAQNNPRQVLGRVPGANYSETEQSGFPANGIGFRGLTPTQSIETNTRQNGYNITADLYGYPESYYLHPLEAVEIIEVTRGPSSLQFGPQFGGVINYILKKGNKTKPFEFVTQQTGGSFGFLITFNSVGGQIGKFNYYSFVQAQTIQGWRPN